MVHSFHLQTPSQRFEALADGKYDHVPEQAFFMCGGLDDVERRAAELAKS